MKGPLFCRSEGTHRAGHAYSMLLTFRQLQLQLGQPGSHLQGKGHGVQAAIRHCPVLDVGGGGAKSNRSTQSPPSSAFVKVSSARHGGLLYIALISSSSSSRDQRSMRTDRYVQPRAPLCYECVSGVCGTSGRGSQSRRAAHPGRSADHSARCAALFSSGEAGREGPALIHTH